MCLGLSNLIVMMWKLKIFSSRMNINSVRENTRTHYRALNMPTWSSESPRGLILRLILFRLFPKSKIFSISFFIHKLIIFFIFLFDLWFAFDYFFLDFKLRIDKSIIFLISLYIKINRPIRLIGESIGNNLLNKLDYFWDELCDSCHNIRRLDFEKSTDIKEVFFPELGYFFSRFVFFYCSLDDLVFDVSDVHDLEDIVAKVSCEYFFYCVETQVGFGMSEMRVGIDGGTTDVPRNSFTFLGDEFGFFLGPKRVLEFETCDETGVIFCWDYPFLKIVLEH